jgi:DUF2950 family protein
MKTNKTYSLRSVNTFATKLAATIALASFFATGAMAADSAKAFISPSAAAAALAEAAKAQDAAAAMQILGPDGKQVISSGDPVADKNAAVNFANNYQQMHRLAYGSKDGVILYLGAQNWPFPIPIVKRSDGWVFDTPAGEKEILYRRIGTNELLTIAALREVVTAEDEYKNDVSEGGSHQFARRLMSDTGTHDGLFWPVSGNEQPSPIGPLIASATAEGYQPGTSGKPSPFHGYLFKILTSQGANAPGGAKDYTVDGKLIGGFAILAYPVEYRSSGVMSFLVNQDGTIFQKDLGADTAKLAAAMNDYNPDKSWEEVKEYSSK